MAEPAHPYQDLPPNAFWRSAVADRAPYALEDLYRRKFVIRPEDKVATGGSCFSQHLSRYMRASGFNVFDVEPPPAWLPADLRLAYGFSTYSARYGNIYTVGQLLQLAKECSGRFAPQDIAWAKGDRVFDALRPAVEPDGYASEAELRFHRAYHLDRVRLLFRQMDVLVFTLGLTEAWTHRASGTVYPTAPGVIAGRFDPQQHALVNFDVLQMAAMFEEFLDCLKAMRADGAAPRIVLTVSPVSLTATASGRHALAANTYTKAALRALAGYLAERHANIDYFPSYEIVMNPAARGIYFDGNLRTITPQGVTEVMQAFFAAHGAVRAPGAAPAPAAVDDAPAARPDAEVQCEDAILEAFGRG